MIFLNKGLFCGEMMLIENKAQSWKENLKEPILQTLHKQYIAVLVT